MEKVNFVSFSVSVFQAPDVSSYFNFGNYLPKFE